LDLDVAVPPDWHRHPLTGHRYDPGVHWSELSDHDPGAGDIKDVWELSRLGWLQGDLRRWAETGDDRTAASVWSVLEDWCGANPRYLGPNWMCGQETSLRTISAMAIADVLDPSAATTDAHRDMVAQMVHDAVGRVSPTLGYALSQRNNHASSEAGFLWGASLLAPWIPGADHLRHRAAAALSELCADQFGSDGSYAQHSPTYQRVALHVLLWCAAVARSTGIALPDGVERAIATSVVHLRSLVVPGTDGRMPNLGGNDGALVFDPAGLGVSDFRPVLAHAACATGQASPFGPGPWDIEARWFGLIAADGAPAVVEPARATHALTRGQAHVVLRAGPMAHRPAHADQLHADIWLDGHPVATDPGSFRYTAPPPWGNALAGEEVHNLPRRPGVPQAVRSGRFFWRSWSEAQLLEKVDDATVTARASRLELADGSVLERTVVVDERFVVVIDRAAEPVVVRWNFPADAHLDIDEDRARIEGSSWRGLVRAIGAGTLEQGPGVAIEVRTPAEDDPASGWQASTYGTRHRCQPLEVGLTTGGSVISLFAPEDSSVALDAVAVVAQNLLSGRLGEAVGRMGSAASGDE
jgi:hypothetical protein